MSDRLARIVRLFAAVLISMISVRASVELPKPVPLHPRLLADADRFFALRKQVETDPASARLFADLRRRADQMLNVTPLTYQKEGRRLLGVSREALARISTLAMVGRLTQNPRFVERAVAELRAVCAFADWNPSHYLDTAEMTLAVALGYDWLYDQLTEADREIFARALLENGVSQAESGPDSQRGWITTRNNWNQVCHAGMVAGAIVLADLYPEIAERTLNRAVENLHISADNYAPDGAYPEGPTYWEYGTTFHVILAAALERFLGDAHGTDTYPGFLASADYMRQMTTPTGSPFSYADCNTAPRGLLVSHYWFARRTGQASLAMGNNAVLAESIVGEPLRIGVNRVEALALLWMDPSLSASDEQPPTSWLGRGPNPVAVHRSAWGDPHATFIGLKGGAASVSHGHMDAGSFVLEADGVRWAVDLGMQDYESLESKGVRLWAGGQDSERWRVFRLGPESHNILRFDGAPPKWDGRGEIVRFSPQPATTVVDLSQVYAGQVAAVSRGVALQVDRSVLIQDEWIAGAEPVEATWQLLTQVEQATADNREVVLREGSEMMVLRVLAPADARIAVEDVSAPRAAYDVANPGLKRITIRTRTAGGSAGAFRILAVPGSVASETVPPQVPLSAWGEPAATP